MTVAAKSAAVNRSRALALLAAMVRIRRFEDRCAELYQQEKIRGFLHLCNGQEAIAVGAVGQLQPQDAVVSTYREHGHALARGVPMERIMAELFGKLDGVCRGRGGSMHLFHQPTRFYGGNAIVAGGIPVAVGLALAEKSQHRSGIVACLFGEGAVAEGAFHESMNLASLWQLPVLFVCENNRYAMGTALDRSEAETDIVLKSRGYRVSAESVDGMDVVAVENSVSTAIEAIRAGAGPCLLECRTYRLRAHSMFDPQLYRDKNEVKEWEARGPLISFTTRMKEERILTEQDYQSCVARADAEIERAVAFADASPLEDVADLSRFVTAQSASHG